ncbi:MAG: alanine racemase, partial [Candidatus Harrisonbacteria bacterium RIFCSPLOWO2_02_FULL_41_11]
AEGLKLRQNSVKKSILVLGPTMPHFLKDAAQNELTVTISNFDALAYFAKSKHKPFFHLKIDTGMHRQGFYFKNLPQVIKIIRNSKLEIRNCLKGVYTHFASAKDLNYPAYTDWQFANFNKAAVLFEKRGFKKLIKHAAATGGTLINDKYHLDAVRTGIGLYGLWPSKELSLQRQDLRFKPALSWHTIISEIKTVKKGDFIGYDLIERANKPILMAILPIGYWHGFPRALSGIGEVLIRGIRAKILGRVSMDLVVVNVSGISCKAGDKATIIGKQKGEEISAFDAAQKLNTIHYELITRINPLIKRIIV